MKRITGTERTLQHTPTHINKHKHSAEHCSTTPTAEYYRNYNTLQKSATNCTALQRTCLFEHTATHCNTLQHTATHRNTLQHTCTGSELSSAADSRDERLLQHTCQCALVRVYVYIYISNNIFICICIYTYRITYQHINVCGIICVYVYKCIWVCISSIGSCFKS